MCKGLAEPNVADDCGADADSYRAPQPTCSLGVAGERTPVSIMELIRREDASGFSSPAVAARLAKIVGVEERSVLVQFDEPAARPLRALAATTLRNHHDLVVVLPLADGRWVVTAQLCSPIPRRDESDPESIHLRAARVCIEASKELILTAGSSKVHLDARGKAVTLADHVVSRSRGVHKIQGGCVQIN